MADKEYKGYHKLIVWQKIKELLLLVYKSTEKLPKSEEYALKNQMRRAIVSVISNFVEGYLKISTKAKLSFLDIANTSLQELEVQAEVCLILDYWTQEDYEKFEKQRGITAYFLNRYISKIKNT